MLAFEFIQFMLMKLFNSHARLTQSYTQDCAELWFKRELNNFINIENFKNHQKVTFHLNNKTYL